MSNRIEEIEGVHNLAEAFADEIWFIAIKWDFFAKHTVGKQLVRAADSISTNIAEGFGRFHYKENKNFCFFRAEDQSSKQKVGVKESENKKLN